MICQKCSFILSGSEDFCPHCGTPCKNKSTVTQPEVVVTEQQSEEAPQIPIPKVRSNSHSAIFDTDDIYSHSAKEKEKSQKKSKSNSKTGISMFLMLFFVLLCIGAVVAMDYLGIVPAISFDRKETTEITETTENTADEGTTEPLENKTDETEKVFSDTAGLVYPDINYKPSAAFVSAQNGASLKKGPYENFAQICILPYDSEVQVIGASSSNDIWVYVYAVSEDCYGWISASFLSTENE